MTDASDDQEIRRLTYALNHRLGVTLTLIAGADAAGILRGTLDGYAHLSGITTTQLVESLHVAAPALEEPDADLKRHLDRLAAALDDAHMRLDAAALAIINDDPRHIDAFMRLSWARNAAITYALSGLDADATMLAAAIAFSQVVTATGQDPTDIADLILRGHADAARSMEEADE